jgi:SAM-dependent methyltransferase
LHERTGRATGGTIDPASDAEAAVDAAIHELANFDLIVNDEAAGGAPSHYLAEHRHEYLRTVRDILRVRPPSSSPVRVLEIGAFFGTVCMALSQLGYQVTAADIPEYIDMPEQVSRYARHGIATKGVRLEQMLLPFADESFDIVVMCEVLEHLNFNPLPLLKEINRIMTPGGLFYLSLPNFARTKNRLTVLRGQAPGLGVRDFYDQLDPANPAISNGHWREYTLPEIRTMLEPLGFRLQEHYYFSYGETFPGGSLRKRLGKLFYQLLPSLKENQTALAIREQRTPLTFTIPTTVHPDLGIL